MSIFRKKEYSVNENKDHEGGHVFEVIEQIRGFKPTVVMRFPVKKAAKVDVLGKRKNIKNAKALAEDWASKKDRGRQRYGDYLRERLAANSRAPAKAAAKNKE